jgi:hypothetical protein
VLFIDVENQEATYDLTVYYTDEELADFDDASALKILLVDGQVIMTLIPKRNYQYNGNATNAEAFMSYEGTFIGSGALTVSEHLNSNLIY